MSDELTRLKRKLEEVMKQREKWYQVSWKSARPEDLSLYGSYLRLEETLKDRIGRLEAKSPTSTLLGTGLSTVFSKAYRRRSSK